MDTEDYPAIDRVINSEVIHQHFGYWPDFHDAEVVRVTFDALPTWRTAVTLTINAFEMTSEVDEHGYFKLIKHCQIELQFTGIQEIEFDGFSYQNVISELWFEEHGSMLKVILSSSVGMKARLTAEEALVLSLIPINRLQGGSRGGAQPI